MKHQHDTESRDRGHAKNLHHQRRKSQLQVESPTPCFRIEFTSHWPWRIIRRRLGADSFCFYTFRDRLNPPSINEVWDRSEYGSPRIVVDVPPITFFFEQIRMQ